MGVLDAIRELEWPGVLDVNGVEEEASELD